VVQKSVFVEGFFTLRNLRSAGTAAVIEVLIAAGIAAVLVWHQLQPVKDIPQPPIAVDPVPDLPRPLERSTPEPQPPMHQDLSQVPPVDTPIPRPNTLPVQAPLPPQLGQRTQPSGDVASDFTAGMLRAINARKVYPKVSMLKGETGETVVSFDYVGGVVSDVHVDRSSGSRELDQAAIQAVRNAALPPKPAELAGLDHFVFTLVFTLGD